MIIGCGIICYAQICLSSIMTELEAIYHNVWEPKRQFYTTKLLPAIGEIISHSSVNDTIFCCYNFSEQGLYAFDVWNHSDTISFSNYLNPRMISPVFINWNSHGENIRPLGQLIQEWDTTTIKIYGVNNPPGVVRIHDQSSVLANRIIIHNDSYSIETIEFLDTWF